VLARAHPRETGFALHGPAGTAVLQLLDRAHFPVG
jgi:hypothetical protein